MKYKKTYSYESHADTPPWYRFRHWLSHKLVFLASKIYPENPRVAEFLMKSMTDYMIYGQSITHVDIKDYYKENKT